MEDKSTWKGWTDYYLNAKYNFLATIGLSEEQILMKYREDLAQLESVENEWASHRNYSSYRDSCFGITNAINILAVRTA